MVVVFGWRLSVEKSAFMGMGWRCATRTRHFWLFVRKVRGASVTLLAPRRSFDQSSGKEEEEEEVIMVVDR